MSRPFVLTRDTKLWHPQVGWQLFPQGSTDPGDAWSDREGGQMPGSETSLQAMRDLIAAQEQIEALQKLLDQQAAGAAAVAKERDEAVAVRLTLEQRAIVAETAQKVAEDAARQYMAERDQARAEVATLKAKKKPIEA